MEKAIGTTNLWMSYKDDPDKEPKMKEELKKWEDATIIRILASTATNHRPDHIMKLLKQEGQHREKPQLFILCNKENTETLFGETFAELVDMKPASRARAEAKLESIIKTRAQGKRKRGEVTEEAGEGEKKSKLSVQSKGKGKERNVI